MVLAVGIGAPLSGIDKPRPHCREIDVDFVHSSPGCCEFYRITVQRSCTL